MAVMRVQLFALAGDPDHSDEQGPLTPAQQFATDMHLTAGLATLPTTDTPGVVVIDTDVAPYSSGAVVHVIAMADHADHVADVVALHLTSTMTAIPGLFTGWRLMAGDSAVWCADN